MFATQGATRRTTRQEDLANGAQPLLARRLSEDRASRLIHLPAHNFYKKFVSENFNFTFVRQTFDEDAESEVFFEVGVPEV